MVQALGINRVLFFLSATKNSNHTGVPMANRTNACSELTRFWLEARHGCLVGEGIPVKVPYALSDIDLVALHPLGHTIALPTGTTIGPRLIIETKDEHDWEPSGREFGALL